MTTLGAYSFRADRTRVLSDLRFVEDRLRRQVELLGLLDGFPTRADFQAELAGLDAAVEAFEAGQATLSLVAGRWLAGRVLRYRKTVDEAARSAAFRLIVLSEDRYERSQTLHEATLELTASGQSLALENAGTAESRPRLTLTALGALLDPRLGDGARALTYHGALAPGDALLLNCDAHTAELSGGNALHELVGDWPRLAPGATTLTYSDDAASSHSGLLRVEYRDFWA